MRLSIRVPATLTLALALVVVGLPFPSGSQAVAAPCGAMTEVDTFTVETKWNKAKYKVGEQAKVEITVTRPGPEDPFKLGVELNSPVQLPAEDVLVSTTLRVGFPPLFRRGETDADGKLTLKLPLEPRTKGTVYASTVATKLHNANGPACSEVQEVGQKHDVPAFKVQ